MLHLGTIRGTTIGIAADFLILAVFFVIMNYNPQHGMLHAVLWVPVLFISVLVHEAAHAIMLGVLGYGPSEIVLGGMGGFTRHTANVRPGHGVLISIAGPLASFGLAWFFNSLWQWFPQILRDPFALAILPLLIGANMFWGKFNLLPLVPLDGGHAVRDFFRMFVNDVTAFTWSVWIGVVVGGGIALYFAARREYFLAIFIAWFVFMNYQRWQDFRDRGTPGD